MKKYLQLSTLSLIVVLLIPTQMQASDLSIAKSLSNAFADIAQLATNSCYLLFKLIPNRRT